MLLSTALSPAHEISQQLSYVPSLSRKGNPDLMKILGSIVLL
jgi:hypothetical protein